MIGVHRMPGCQKPLNIDASVPLMLVFRVGRVDSGAALLRCADAACHFVGLTYMSVLELEDCYWWERRYTRQ